MCVRVGDNVNLDGVIELFFTLCVLYTHLYLSPSPTSVFAFAAICYTQLCVCGVGDSVYARAYIYLFALLRADRIQRGGCTHAKRER